jgi:hypothetical protein
MTEYTSNELAIMNGGHTLDKPKFSFIREEILESRYIRTSSDISAYDVDVPETFFEHVLMLQQLRYENPRFAQKYARDTLRYQSFSTIKTEATDLHNLAVILNNPSRYRSKTSGLGSVSFDQVKFKRYLRDLINGRNDVQFVRSYLLQLQKTLGISGSTMRIARRVLSDYNISADGEKSSVTTRLKASQWRDGKFRSDIFRPYTKAT